MACLDLDLGGRDHPEGLCSTDHDWAQLSIVVTRKRGMSAAVTKGVVNQEPLTADRGAGAHRMVRQVTEEAPEKGHLACMCGGTYDPVNHQ